MQSIQSQNKYLRQILNVTLEFKLKSTDLSEQYYNKLRTRIDKSL